MFHDTSDWIWMTLIMAFFWVPIVWAALWAITRTSRDQDDRPRPRPHEPEDARDIARAAYARGELTREQFLEVIEDLDRTEHPAAR